MNSATGTLKPSSRILYGDSQGPQQTATKQVLWTVLRDTLILLHPFAPFVTEEIWDKLPGTRGSVMQASYPDPHGYVTDHGRSEQSRAGDDGRSWR